MIQSTLKARAGSGNGVLRSFLVLADFLSRPGPHLPIRLYPSHLNRKIRSRSPILTSIPQIFAPAGFIFLASSISRSLLPGLRDLIIMTAVSWWLNTRTRTTGLMTIPERSDKVGALWADRSNGRSPIRHAERQGLTTPFRPLQGHQLHRS